MHDLKQDLVLSIDVRQVQQEIPHGRGEEGRRPSLTGPAVRASNHTWCLRTGWDHCIRHRIMLPSVTISDTS